MGALTIAFDTIIVGALALPWVVLVVHLFFLEGEIRLAVLMRWIKRQQMGAAAGVLLFAAAYTLGSAVSRIAQDFFNDDDLYVHVYGLDRWFRMGATENRILTSVYCDREDNELLPAGTAKTPLGRKIHTFQCQKTEYCGKDCVISSAGSASANLAAQENCKGGIPNNLCEQTLDWIVPRGTRWEEDDELNGTGADIFGLEEAALLLKGEDDTQRLRTLHDQIMVLRGAAFNGLIGFSLCLFVWGASLRRERPNSMLRWAITMTPAFFLAVSALALKHHIHERSATAPPYMEFSLLLIGLAGGLLLWIRRRVQPTHATVKPAELCRRWAGLTLLSGVLTVAAVLGWWATEVAYAQEVIYSYDSQVNGTQTPNTKAPDKSTAGPQPKNSASQESDATD